jgi:hypothetical protein
MQASPDVGRSPKRGAAPKASIHLGQGALKLSASIAIAINAASYRVKPETGSRLRSPLGSTPVTKKATVAFSAGIAQAPP